MFQLEIRANCKCDIASLVAMPGCIPDGMRIIAVVITAFDKTSSFVPLVPHEITDVDIGEYVISALFEPEQWVIETRVRSAITGALIPGYFVLNVYTTGDEQHFTDHLRDRVTRIFAKMCPSVPRWRRVVNRVRTIFQ